jgi:hypothetical protein
MKIEKNDLKNKTNLGLYYSFLIKENFEKLKELDIETLLKIINLLFEKYNFGDEKFKNLKENVLQILEIISEFYCFDIKKEDLSISYQFNFKTNKEENVLKIIKNELKDKNINNFID